MLGYHNKESQQHGIKARAKRFLLNATPENDAREYKQEEMKRKPGSCD